MSGSMSRADLIADLRDSLHDAASVFTAPAEQDFIRLLDIAAADLGRVRTRIMSGSLTLVAGQSGYAAPADLIDFISDTWGAGVTPYAWEVCYPGPNPRVAVAYAGGVRSLLMSPAPTALQISLYGSAYPYTYLAGHTVSETAADTTVPAGERSLLLLRAQAEAMREVAIRNSAKPVSMRDGYSGMPRNGTPAALYQVLLKEWREAVR